MQNYELLLVHCSHLIEVIFKQILIKVEVIL